MTVRADNARAASFEPWPDYLPPLAGLDERLVQPRFDGLGLANVAPSILRTLTGTPGDGLSPLDECALPAALAEGVTGVILLVADGLGHQQLLREVEAGNAPALASALHAARSGDARAHYAVLTSVFPTTTVAALGSLNSGVTPLEHGLLGYTVWLRELGVVAEMIRWGPLDRRGTFADPVLGGHSPEAFFGAPTLYQRLRSVGVERTFAVNPSAFAGTALTRMLHQGAEYRGYTATSSLSVLVSQLVRESHTPTYVYAYWPTVDTVTHLKGPTSEEHAAEVAALDRGFERLLARLPRRDDTLLLLTADHGHVDTCVHRQVLLNDYPDLLALLAHYPAGERRATYLHAQPGEAARLEALCRERLRDVCLVMSRDEALERGLFGPRRAAEPALDRVGDVLLFPRGDLQIAYSIPEEHVPPDQAPPKPTPFCGLHGGLAPEEALVPLLALRL